MPFDWRGREPLAKTDPISEVDEARDAMRAVELSHTRVTSPEWWPYLVALEMALPKQDEEEYPAGVAAEIVYNMAMREVS